jgi:hypothetical protein
LEQNVWAEEGDGGIINYYYYYYYYYHRMLVSSIYFRLLYDQGIRETTSAARARRYFRSRDLALRRGLSSFLVPFASASMVHLPHISRPNFLHYSTNTSPEDEADIESSARENSSQLQDALESLVEDPNAPGKDKEKLELDAHGFLEDDEGAGEHLHEHEEGGEEAKREGKGKKAKGKSWLQKFFSEDSIDKVRTV